jgi:acetyl/propionyl-CoA carboxylase alpha subunit
MGETAVAAARAVGYASAGTVEFLVDAHRNYYFLEMNTRLQVEHPVTELVTGVDLVQAQLRIAAGERLWLRQEDLCQRGHAIECRIYAEDPAQGHLPATGTLLSVEEPWAPGVRVDSGVEAGSVVTHHYDPLLAKVVACAEDRAGALDRMEAALSRYVLLGIPTNVRFLEDVLRHETFRSGTATTGFLDEHFADWSPPLEPVPDLVFIAAAVGATAAPASGPAAAPALHDPWRAADGFRLGGR